MEQTSAGLTDYATKRLHATKMDDKQSLRTHLSLDHIHTGGKRNQLRFIKTCEVSAIFCSKSDLAEAYFSTYDL